jgi:clostripain
MKNDRQFYAGLIALLIFVMLCGSVQTTFAQKAPAEWTMMFYMDSDNNLEDAQMQDLEEMMAVGSSSNVNIIVLADRSDKGDDEEGYTSRAVGSVRNWTTAKLMVVERGRLRELGDWGEVNMGDPNNLKKFLETVTAQFPAKRYGLVFGDHGSGWSGIVSDESADGDTLTTKELPLAFRDITAKTGKLELIGFDACLMGNFESAQAIAPFGKTMVASEELEPGDGWHYTPLFNTLVNNPNMDGFALGKTVVDTYRDYYLGPKQGNKDKTVTLGVIDLSKISALETAINNLGMSNQKMMQSGGRNSWLKTARARKSTEEFGRGDSEAENSHYYDVINYAENIKLENANPETVQAADAVINAMKAAVVYKINGAGHPHSNGLSIYFPPNKNILMAESAFPYQQTPFSLTSKWLPFLANYAGIEVADTQKPQLQNVVTNDPQVAKDDVITVTSAVKGDDIDEATFVLAESHPEGVIVIGAIPTDPDEKGLLKEEWDGSWFTIGDGEKEVICPITNFEELDDAQDTFLAEVPAQVRLKGTKKWRDVKLYFLLDFNEEEVVGEFVYAFEFKKNQAREIDIDTGDSVRPVYLAIDNNGESEFIASDDEDDVLNITEDDDITVGRDDVAAGKYLIGFSVVDYAGNSNEEFTEVELK